MFLFIILFFLHHLSGHSSTFHTVSLPGCCCCLLQIKDEIFLEAISSILNIGEIPGLFPTDEKHTICDKMRNIDRQRDKSKQVSQAQAGSSVESLKQDPL